MPQRRPDIFYLHFLRFFAAYAVILIHVLGPFRDLYGQIAYGDWFAAMSINAVTRWAVPICMLISGALLISSNKPFEFSSYMQKRLGEVVVPFVAWTVIYSVLSGFDSGAFDWATARDTLIRSPQDPAWYHLWFFYDFIPLYFVMPFFALLLKSLDTQYVLLLLAGWGVLTLLYWLKVDNAFDNALVMYSGYVILGWFLFNRDNSNDLRFWGIAGAVMLLCNVVGSAWFASLEGEYSSAFMGYKTLNTAVIAVMIFVVAQTHADRITGAWRRIITSISTYVLGSLSCIRCC